MASVGLLLLSAALIHTSQPLPAARGGGRGLDSVGGVRRQRRDLQDLLPYEDRMMSFSVGRGGGGANDPYYPLDDWRGRGLDQALKRLVERDQRREEEEEQQAYLAALLRLLSQAESAGLVGPGEVEVVEEEEDEEDDQGPQGDFQGPVPMDYDETGRGGMSMGRPQGARWALVEPRLAQALLDRMEPRLAQALLQRANQERVQQLGRVPSGRDRDRDRDQDRDRDRDRDRDQDRDRDRDRDTLSRRLVARLLSGVSADDAAAAAAASSPAGPRARRDLSVRAAAAPGPAHRRSRRSVDEPAPPAPSDNPPLLRVKRLEDGEEEEEEEEEEARRLRPHAAAAGLQRMKRIDEEELNRGRRRRRRRAAVNYDPQILIQQILEYMRE